MALDPSFDTDAMAKALGIPSNKHMLHRHLYEEMKSLSVPLRYICRTTASLNVKKKWFLFFFSFFLNNIFVSLSCLVYTAMQSRATRFSLPHPWLLITLQRRGCLWEEQERYHCTVMLSYSFLLSHSWEMRKLTFYFMCFHFSRVHWGYVQTATLWSEPWAFMAAVALCPERQEFRLFPGPKAAPCTPSKVWKSPTSEPASAFETIVYIVIVP